MFPKCWWDPKFKVAVGHSDRSIQDKKEKRMHSTKGMLENSVRRDEPAETLGDVSTTCEEWPIIHCRRRAWKAKVGWKCAAAGRRLCSCDPCNQPLSCFSGPSLLRVMGDAIALSQFDFHTFGVKHHTSGFGFTHCSHFLFGPFPLSQWNLLQRSHTSSFDFLSWFSTHLVCRRPFTFKGLRSMFMCEAVSNLTELHGKACCCFHVTVLILFSWKITTWNQSL